jgi:hypothetical protein
VKSTLTLSAALVCLLFSCRRDAVDSPKPQDAPKLVLSILKDTSGIVGQITHYNSMELLAFDTTFNNGKPYVWQSREYNSKGKPVKVVTTAPVFNPNGYLYTDFKEYKDDTVLVGYRHFLKGTETGNEKYFYNSSGQRILDSNYHRPIGGTTWAGSAIRYTYEFDPQGRKIAETQVIGNGDSSLHSVYTYGPGNHQEKLTTSYYYNPFRKFTSLSTFDYTASGKILSEKNYDFQNQLSLEYDYTYDGNGNLIKKNYLDGLGNRYEELYINNSFGKLERMERWSLNKLNYTIYYYYE